MDNEVRSPLRYSFYLALFATVLAFVVIILGAYTRLTDAGLGCPDWPGCYGKWIVTQSMIETNSIQITKAWTEMIHRYLAGSLGLTIFILAFLVIRNQHFSKQSLLLPLILVALVIFQALLGMWTVTLKLYPLVVMAHLLGGLTTFSLLGWLTLKLNPIQTENFINDEKLTILRSWSMIGLLVLIVQLFLGGWTSANYAALVCLDFPFCNANQSYDLNFSGAFNLVAAGVTGSIGEPLDNAARITIHMLHRIGALLTTVMIGTIALLTFLNTINPLLRTLSIIMISLTLVQVLLGITNVLALLPLSIAVLHNGVAALLLLSLVILNYFLYLKPKKYLKYEYAKFQFI